MSLWLSSIFLAFALAADAFAVAIGTGLYLKDPQPRQIFRLTWHFGLFQGGMTFLGFLMGSLVAGWFTAVDHWIAFGLLAYLGLSMIRESFSSEEDNPTPRDPTKGKSLVLLSLGTSIDAWAAGLSLALIDHPIVIPSVLIGVITGLLTGVGLWLGSRLSRAWTLGAWAERGAGLVLVGIGVHILIDHGVFG